MKHIDHAAKKFILILLCVLLAGLLSACGSAEEAAPAAAEPPAAAAELGIYAFGTTAVSTKDQGHTFLTLKNNGSETIDFLNYPIVPGEEITLSFWNSYGVRLNYDAIKDLRNQDHSHEVVSMRKDLTAAEVQTLLSFTVEYAGREYNGLDSNCTTYAVEAWNLVNEDKPIGDTSFLNKMMDIDAPKWTKEYILENVDAENMSVEQYDPYDNLDDFDVFYIHGDGTLAPDYIALRDYTATVDTENTPCNIDIRWEKWAKEMCDGTMMINLVLARYGETAEFGSTQTRFDADAGGGVLADLKPHTTYFVQLCPVYEYTYRGETRRTTGDWTPAIEVTTGGSLPEIVFTYHYGTEVGEVTATDPETGELVWSYATPGGEVFQLDRAAEVRLCGAQYYLQEERDLVCLDAYTGAELWRLEDQIDWGPVSTFDEEENLYLAFYLSDYVMQISPEGEILHTLHTDEFGYADAFWPTELQVRDGALGIHFTGDTYGGDTGDHWGYIDLETWIFTEP